MKIFARFKLERKWQYSSQILFAFQRMIIVQKNIGAFCLRMRENRSVRLQMADFKGFVSFVMVFMKNMD
jgi:hypothetical protein